MKINKITLLLTEIPMKIRVKHALTDVLTTQNIFIKIVSENHVGFGESVPKKYSSGTSPEQTFDSIRDILNDTEFKSMAFNDLGDIDDFIQNKLDDNAAKCALELALIDVYAKEKGVHASDLFGGNKRSSIFYSPVITKKTLLECLLYSFIIRISGFDNVKVKVGFDDDHRFITLIKWILGDKINIRVDANCAWNLDTALEKILKLMHAGVQMVEQPVCDLSDLQKIINKSQLPILIDESIRTEKDAEDLLKIPGPKKFVLKLSKNGGLFNSKRIYDSASKHNTGCILSSQVGETGVLSAAGRLFAFINDDLEYIEGSYGNYLFKEDIVHEKLGFGLKGKAYPLDINGLGVTVKEKKLEKFVIKKFEKEY